VNGGNGADVFVFAAAAPASGKDTVQDSSMAPINSGLSAAAMASPPVTH